ncbi:MAG: tagaturonate epimerase family protein [Melioribacteraceae bacterium]
MIKEQLLKSYESVKSSKNEKFTLEIEKINVLVYENSIHKYDEYLFFIGVTENNKNLFIYSDSKSELLNNFDGSIILKSENEVIKKSDFTHKNVLELQKIFDFTVSKVIGLKNSFGFGDRIGTANPAHLRSLSVNPDFIPVLAQQSIRELTRTQREAEDVMDAAVWAVMQEGFTTGFGADADHLKTTDDIDRMVKAGYKMFTFDPNEHVVNEADSISVDDLKEYVKNLKWKNDEATDAVINRYSNEVIEINNELKLAPSEEDTLRAFVKYGKSILFINKMNNYLRSTYPKWDVEVEVSVDETESVTTPFEHYFMVNELTLLNVDIISLAPRFIGDFEKGIDYIGDLEIFKTEYIKHLAITEYFGNYKISLHSGSDKFDVYKTIGSLKRGVTHVKTAGTSYLEALRVVATVDVKLFGEILDFSRKHFEVEKKTYHISADINKVLSADSYKDEELKDLLNQNDARQVFHVTFGLVLTIKDDANNYIYRNRIYKCLEENEDLHYEYLTKHFEKHLLPFK